MEVNLAGKNIVINCTKIWQWKTVDHTMRWLSEAVSVVKAGYVFCSVYDQITKINDYVPTPLEIKCIQQGCPCEDQDETHK